MNPEEEEAALTELRRGLGYHWPVQPATKGLTIFDLPKPPPNMAGVPEQLLKRIQDMDMLEYANYREGLLEWANKYDEKMKRAGEQVFKNL